MAKEDQDAGDINSKSTEVLLNLARGPLKICKYFRTEVEFGSAFIYNVIALCVLEEHESVFRPCTAEDSQDTNSEVQQ